jgi:hypothetical protein
MWWKGNIKNKVSDSNTLHDQVAKKIAAIYIRAETAFAVFLTKRTSNLSSTKLKIIFLSFCASWFSVSMYFIWDALWENGPEKRLNILHFKAPKNNVKDFELKPKESQLLTIQEYLEVIAFRKYMDSLKNHDKKYHDSILLTRPGLMDSLTKLEQMYYQTKK